MDNPKSKKKKSTLYADLLYLDSLKFPSRESPKNRQSIDSLIKKEVSQFLKEKQKRLMERINDYMHSSEQYTNKELTIADMAAALDVHTRDISRTINMAQKLNFNSYINRFRIGKAMALLIDTKYANLSVEGIGQEVGFHSKSAFYAAFKKVSGTTPTKFRMQNRSNS